MVSNKKNKKKERNGSKKKVLYYSKVIIGKYSKKQLVYQSALIRAPLRTRNV